MTIYSITTNRCVPGIWVHWKAILIPPQNAREQGTGVNVMVGRGICLVSWSGGITTSLQSDRKKLSPSSQKADLENNKLTTKANPRTHSRLDTANIIIIIICFRDGYDLFTFSGVSGCSQKKKKKFRDGGSFRLARGRTGDNQCVLSSATPRKQRTTTTNTKQTLSSLSEPWSSDHNTSRTQPLKHSIRLT